MKMLLGGLLLLAGCTDGYGVSATSQQIIGGAAEAGQTSTVMIASYPTDKSTLDTCSGVAISPTVVLTAAHCVDDANHPSYIYGVFVDADANPYNGQIVQLEPHLLAVKEVHAFPGYIGPTSPFTGDIGVVIMNAPLPMAPTPIARTAPAGGVDATIAGYGQTTSGTNNYARFSADTVTGAIDADTIAVGDAGKHGCLGDSGGPAFVGGKVIGVDSYGPVGCTGPAHYRRTDAYLDFIDQYVPAEPVADDFPPTDGFVGSDPAGNGNSNGNGGCCQTGQAGSVTGGLLFALFAIPLRRRRRYSAPTT